MPPERTCDWAVHISDLPLACVHEYWLMAVTELRSRVFLIEGANYCARMFSGRLDVPSKVFTHRVNGTESMFASSKRQPLGRRSWAAHTEYSETRRCCRELYKRSVSVLKNTINHRSTRFKLFVGLRLSTKKWNSESASEHSRAQAFSTPTSMKYCGVLL